MKRFIRFVIPSRIWTKLRLRRLRHTLGAYKRRLVRHTYAGFPLDIELVDPLGEGWYDHDWPEPPEFEFLARHGSLRLGARIFDLGAHQGVIALMLSRYVGATGSILALEANGHNAGAARRNFELNGAANCEALLAAVGQESGKLVFSEGLNGSVDNGSADWGQVEVDAYSIDDLARRYGPPHLLFIDVEGYECQALEGAKNTLRTAKPDAFIEIHRGAGLESFGGSVEKVLSYFPRSDYDLHFNDEKGEEFRPVTKSGELPGKRFFLIALARPSQI